MRQLLSNLLTVKQAVRKSGFHSGDIQYGSGFHKLNACSLFWGWQFTGEHNRQEGQIAEEDADVRETSLNQETVLKQETASGTSAIEAFTISSPI